MSEWIRWIVTTGLMVAAVTLLAVSVAKADHDGADQELAQAYPGRV